MIRALPLTICVLMAAPAVAADRRFDVEGFTKVEVGSGLTAEIAEGDAFGVVAEGAPRALRRLDIHTRGKTLVVEQEARGFERFSPLMWALADEVVVRVTLPDLEAVTASAGSDVSAAGSAAGAFAAEASSGADLEVSGVAADTVRVTASSGASLAIAGTCGDVTARASSGADLDAGELVCETASAEASSGAGIDLTAATVRAEASSGADIEVRGAETVEADESSGGDVHVRD